MKLCLKKISSTKCRFLLMISVYLIKIGCNHFIYLLPKLKANAYFKQDTIEAYK